MDYVSHGVWSYIFFHRVQKPYLAVLFGLLPDTLSWWIYLVYTLATGGYSSGPPDPSLIPAWVFLLYGISHSLVVFSLVALTVFLVLRKVPVVMFAWPIAIITDTLTHSADFLPTPFLWPLSDWRFPGYSWGHPWFLITNAVVMVVLLVWIYIKKRY